MATFSKKKTYSLILILLISLIAIVYKDSLSVYMVRQSLTCSGKNRNILHDIALTAINKYQYPTIQIAYMDNNHNLSTCVAGWEGQWWFSKKVTNSTHYAYASLTKIFTSDKILSLIRSDKLKLESKLVDNIPLKHNKFADNRIKDITVANLLSHRAGFDRNISGDLMFAQRPWCPYKIEALTSIGLDFPPNQRKAYSNLGYCLLSQVIVNNEKKDFVASIEDTYHFNDSDIHFIQRRPNELPQVPVINTVNLDRGNETETVDFYALSADGGLYGSAIALVKQLNALEKVKTPNITQHPQNINDCNIKQIDGCHGYMGYEYSINPTLKFYWRSGSLSNTTSFAIIDNKGGSLVFLTNHRDDNEWGNQINLLIKQLYAIRLKNN